MKSWIQIDKNSDFSIHNIPLGIFSTADKTKRPATRIGDFVVDLLALQAFGYFDDVLKEDDFNNVLETEYLNPIFDLAKPRLAELRLRIQQLFNITCNELQHNKEHLDFILHPIHQVQLHLPIKVSNYTDFYSSREHAFNVGTMFRGPENALMPNWKHLPVGYHGRASSIVISGTSIKRPKGQYKPADKETPEFGYTKQMDIELEMAFITRSGKPLGESISIEEAPDYIVGMCIFNDWSARDIQAWEYVPLGPFLGKNFASTMSPWIVLMEALKPFEMSAVEQDVEVLPYLQDKTRTTFDIALEVDLITEGNSRTTICYSNYNYLYWTMAQQLAHHTINGCNIQCGDVMASGTISGSKSNSYGSLLELGWRGTKPIQLHDGTERKFLHNGDTIEIRAFCVKDDVRVGFGTCAGKIIE